MFRHGSPKILFLIVTIMTVVSIRSTRAADFPGGVQGVVKSASGESLSGAYVKLFNAERRLTFMVISQAGGRYTATNLPSGKYTVQGIGNGFQSKFTTVDVAASKPATADVSLTDKQGPYVENGWPGTPGTVGGNEVWGMMPQPKLVEGPGMEIVKTKCIQCHELYRIVLQRWGKERWAEKVENMRDRIHEESKKYIDLTDAEEKTVVDYLTKNYSGDAGTGNAKFDPNGRLSRTLLKGAEAKYIAMDFEIPIADTEPHDLVIDPRGIAWTGYRQGCCLGKFDPKTFTFTQVQAPSGEHVTWVGAPAVGAGDSIWMADGGRNRRWFQFDTKAEKFTVYPAPQGITGNIGGNTMRVHPDGKTVWSSNGNRMIGLNIASKEFAAYPIPSWEKTKKPAGSYGVAISGDGKVWFAERDANLIGRLDPTTGKMDEFKVPGEDQLPKPGSVPRRMGADAEGNIWLGLHETGKLVKIDYKTTKMTVLDPPTKNSAPYSVAADPKRNWIWASEQTSDKIARYDPKTNTWTEFSLPIIESDARRIEIDPTNPNRIWWSGDTANRLGYIEILP